MFGIDDLLLYPLIGAASGAIMNKKKPLQGALLGGGLGALGGQFLPGLLSPAAGGSGLTMGAPGMGLQMAGGVGLTPPATALASQTPASSGLLAALKEYKPVMDAAALGMQMAGQDRKEPIPPPQPFQAGGQGGPQTLSNLVNNQHDYQQNMLMDSAEARRRRRLAMGGLI